MKNGTVESVEFSLKDLINAGKKIIQKGFSSSIVGQGVKALQQVGFVAIPKNVRAKLQKRIKALLNLRNAIIDILKQLPPSKRKRIEAKFRQLEQRRKQLGITINTNEGLELAPVIIYGGVALGGAILGWIGKGLWDKIFNHTDALIKEYQKLLDEAINSIQDPQKRKVIKAKAKVLADVKPTSFLDDVKGLFLLGLGIWGISQLRR